MTLTNWLIADAAFIALTAGFTGYAIGVGKDPYITINGLGMVLWFILFLNDVSKIQGS